MGVPGGALEPRESWVDAALHECREETGWRAGVDGLHGIYGGPATHVHIYPGGDEQHLVGVVVLATAAERDGVPDDEAVDVRWFERPLLSVAPRLPA